MSAKGEQMRDMILIRLCTYSHITY